MLCHYSLFTKYISFLRPHIVYSGVLHEQPNNNSLCQKIKTPQYDTARIITGVMKGIFQMKLYNKLVLESLEF